MPEYETVSYVGGDASLRGAIQLNGHFIDVPISSADALRRMRPSTGRDRVVWIDAICINQADLVERAQQVSIMYEVFSNTWRNLIWLGPDDGCTTSAVESVEAIVKEMEVGTTSYANVFSTFWRPDGTFRLSDTGILAAIDVDAISRFFASPWWLRLWVVQEASLAPQSVCIRGNSIVALELPLRAAQWMFHRSLHIGGTREGLQGIKHAASIADFADHKTGWFGPRNNYACASNATFLDLLRHFRSFVTDDPRDHVYGLLGLYKRFSSDLTLPEGLSPDYTQDVGEVLRDATSFIISTQKDLGVLNHISYVIDDWRRHSIPTWTPRFDLALDFGYSFSFSEEPVRFAEEFHADGNIDANERPIEVVNDTLMTLGSSSVLLWSDLKQCRLNCLRWLRFWTT